MTTFILPAYRFADREVPALEHEWLTTEEAARYLKVHRETLRRWARRGVAPAVKFGNRGGFRFKREELDRFMERHTRRP
jgi:excisionase family DNA binding protein